MDTFFKGSAPADFKSPGPKWVLLFTDSVFIITKTPVGINDKINVSRMFGRAKNNKRMSSLAHPSLFYNLVKIGSSRS